MNNESIFNDMIYNKQEIKEKEPQFDIIDNSNKTWEEFSEQKNDDILKKNENDIDNVESLDVKSELINSKKNDLIKNNFILNSNQNDSLLFNMKTEYKKVFSNYNFDNNNKNVYINQSNGTHLYNSKLLKNNNYYQNSNILYINRTI